MGRERRSQRRSGPLVALEATRARFRRSILACLLSRLAEHALKTLLAGRKMIARSWLDAEAP